MYAFAIGELQIKPAEFWNLTSGELYAITNGRIRVDDRMSLNFRNLYVMMYNRWAKGGPRTPSQLWPLSFDRKASDDMTMDEIYERNRKILADENS